MKGNVSRGGGFRGVLNYLLVEEGMSNQPRPGASLIGGNLDGHNPRTLANEFGASRGLRPDCVRPVWHTSLSLPAGEHLTDTQWQEAAEKLLAKVGMDPAKHQFTLIKHTDAEHEHAHLVASRIGLDAELWHGKWEARAVHDATQEIEKEMGLTLTPGRKTAEQDYREAQDQKGPQVKISQKERKMWEGKGVEVPPKVELACAIESAIQEGNGTVDDLQRRLALQNITTHVNQAKTGRISGISFEMERGGETCRYKASQVHKAYSWKNLSQRLEQKYEVEHGQNRGNEAERDAGAEGEAGTDQRASARDFELAAELTRAAAGGGGQNIPGSEFERASAEPFSATERNFGDSEAEHRRGVESHQNRSREAVLEQQSQSATDDQASSKRSEEDQRFAGENTDASSKLEHGSNESEYKSYELKHEGDKVKHGGGKVRKSELQNDDTKRSNSISRDSAVDRNNVDWNKLLEQKSQRKSRDTGARKGFKGVASNVSREPEQNKTVDRELVAGTKSIDPAPYFKSRGYEVKKDGQNHLSIRMDGVEHYRSSFKEGKWLHCHNTGEGIGDNIALVREMEGCGFAEAVYSLHGSPEPSIHRPRSVACEKRESKKPRLPRQTIEARQEGRAYLQQRGISQDTIKHAEQSGFLYHVGGGPTFVGRDEQNEARCVTKRLIEPQYNQESGKWVTKRDLVGTDKTYPPILAGNNDVWVVEGGADALAVRDLHERHGMEPPTVLVSGGADVLKCFNSEYVQSLLKDADKVVVAYDNEKDPQTQAEKDRAHEKQADKIREFNGEVYKFQPDQKYKDMAEWNKAEQKRSLYDKEAQQAAKEERQEREMDRGPKMGM